MSDKRVNVIFDLDAVIRSLSDEVNKKYGDGRPIESYNRNINGKSVVEWINHDLTILYSAKPTEYYPVIKKYFPKPIIWSHQFENWLPMTHRWLSDFFEDYDLTVMDSKTKMEEINKLDNTMLVEDYPFFKSYKKIVLITRPYNTKIHVPIRISTPQKLEDWIKENGNYGTR